LDIRPDDTFKVLLATWSWCQERKAASPWWHSDDGPRPGT